VKLLLILIPKIEQKPLHPVVYAAARFFNHGAQKVFDKRHVAAIVADATSP
jgi:hypothetical protein